jgi:hypothetical protein
MTRLHGSGVADTGRPRIRPAHRYDHGFVELRMIGMELVSGSESLAGSSDNESMRTRSRVLQM